MLHAEVISIGDELTSGQRLDTNSQWLSERLGELGIRVLYHTTVADDLAANVLVFRQASQRVDIVVATGGLGPTADDLTREALAQAAGVGLVLDEPSLAHVRGLFARRQRPMPERNVVQAMFPAGSRPIFNEHGTAPGIALELPRPAGGVCRVYALPGVPDEMREMWQTELVPELARLDTGARVIRHRRIKCFGVGESDLEAMLPDLIRRGREPAVGITVSGATITLRITAAGATPEECLTAMEPTVATIRECLGTLVFGEEDNKPEHAVARLLARSKQTLAIAEWGTGGLVARRLAAVPEADGHFLGGLVVRSAAAATRLLGLPPALLDQHAGASAEVAGALAAACRERFAADLALAVSEFPVYDEQAPEPGRVYYALSDPAGVQVTSSAFAGHPAILKTRAAKQALNVVRLEIVKGRG